MIGGRVEEPAEKRGGKESGAILRMQQMIREKKMDYETPSPSPTPSSSKQVKRRERRENKRENKREIKKSKSREKKRY